MANATPDQWWSHGHNVQDQGQELDPQGKCKDLTLKAKAKDLTLKAKAKDLTLWWVASATSDKCWSQGHTVQDQGQGLDPQGHAVLETSWGQGHCLENSNTTSNLSYLPSCRASLSSGDDQSYCLVTRHMCVTKSPRVVIWSGTADSQTQNHQRHNYYISKLCIRYVTPGTITGPRFDISTTVCT